MTSMRWDSSREALGLGLDRPFDGADEVVGALACGAHGDGREQLPHAVALEVVPYRQARGAGAIGLQVVAARRDGDHVLRALGPADPRRGDELRDLELALGRQAGVLDGAGVDRADTR